MLESSSLAARGLGFVLGLKHAIDPDHIAVVTTFLSGRRSNSGGPA